jgi:hypothetical protein
MMNNQDRVYWEDRDITIPAVDENARYQIRNKHFSLIQIQTKDPVYNQLVPMNLKGRETIVLHGSQITNYIWDLERRGFIKVDMMPMDDEE